MSEISPTAFPAYDDTSIALRSLDESRKEQKRKNFSAAAHRLRMKTNLELKLRSKA
jgi:phage head maturation protease